MMNIALITVLFCKLVNVYLFMKEKVKALLAATRTKAAASVRFVRALPRKVSKQTLYWLVPALVIVVGLGILVVVPGNHWKKGGNDDTAAAVQISATPEIPAVGTYGSGWLPAASSPGREFTLALSDNGNATFTGDYKNGQKLVVETGVWTREGDRLTVTVDSRFGFKLDAPVTYAFTVSEGMLTLVDYNKARWGAMGLTLKRSE